MQQLLDDWFTIQPLDSGLFGVGELGHYEEVLSYLLLDPQGATLIDTGLGIVSIMRAVRKITDQQVRALNTHSHFDHIGSNHEIHDVRLLDHPLCRDVALRGVPAHQLEQWITPDQFWGRVPPFLPCPYFIPSFPQATYFRDGDVIDAGTFRFTVIHTPGHSEDSVCFHEPERGWLFAGDLFYDGPIYIEPAGGLAKYRRSLERIKTLTGVTRIFVSHNAFEISIPQLERLMSAVEELPTKELEGTVEIEGRMRLVPG